jgi:murein L,D-transpeptidase YcbB/YkuD
MRNWVSNLACSAAAAALVTGSAIAQDRGAIASTGQIERTDIPASVPAPQNTATFDQTFAETAATPVVPTQGVVAEAKAGNWSEAQVAALIAVIENIGAEGLDPADYDRQPLKVSLRSGPSQELNEIATRNFTWLVEDLRDGRTPMKARTQWFVVDPDRERFPTKDLLAKALATGDIAGTLASLNPAHPDYAALKAELAKTPASQTSKRKLIRANMDRWRWLQRDLGTTYLITNVPEFQLRLTVGDKIIKTYRTIVGKPGRTATPQLAEMVEGVVFNPTWTVPQSIVKGEGLGAKVLGNPGWAKSAGYTATKGPNGHISVVQQPGPTNSLGRMKLEMPNPHAIFFHDTPSRHLFANANRALSHGCIRTENALEVAMLVAILGKGTTKDEAVEISTSGKYTKVTNKRQLPAYITYFTMATDINGKMATFSDIYGRDAPVLASLDKPRERNRSTVIEDEVIVIEDDLRDS